MRPYRDVSTRSKSGRAFTLVELLIVVGIIALLVTIIMPSLTRARELARQAVCLSNHNSMVKALHVYNADYQAFPNNYAHNYGPWTGDYRRWAFGHLNRYLAGDRQEYLRGLDEGEFPRAYICPSADLIQVYLYNPSDKYHACYWTNVAIRANRGFYGGSGGLFNTWYHTGKPAGWDVDSGGMARLWGKHCAGHWRPECWRSVYQPSLDSLKMPADTVFSGDTNNKHITTIPDADGNPVDLYHPTYPGEWFIRPGWGWIYGSLGFDRHLNKLLMGFVSGGARALSHEYLDRRFCHWPAAHNALELTGDFMIQFTAEESCRGTDIHELPQRVGRWE
jgi:prepilin-type N-terminal cleavage/methylation domain-containing protein